MARTTVHWRVRGVRAVVLATVFVVAASIEASGTPSPDWVVYHGGFDPTGAATALSSVSTSSPAWTSRALDGQLYGEPLVYGDDVYVADENDSVYELSARSGAVVWRRHLATPVPSSALPCGDIAPSVGITGTPVIDVARHELFVVADEDRGGVIHHWLVGLATSNGRVELSKEIDPAGSYPPALLQRTGLTLDDGRVVWAMGGNWGDCSTYRGRVGEMAVTGGPTMYFTVDNRAGDSQGAIWMGGAAPVVDPQGNIWVTSGNGSVYDAASPYDDSDAVLELSATLRLRQYFAPRVWASDNASDRDVSTAPALVDGLVVDAGKSPTIYLLRENNLGGIGGQVATLASTCGTDIDGGDAVIGSMVYLPCLNGPIAIRVKTDPDTMTTVWQAAVGGGPVIEAAHELWTLSQNGTLYGLNPATGAVRQQIYVGAPANHFPTPSAGDGHLFVATATHVVALGG